MIKDKVTLEKEAYYNLLGELEKQIKGKEEEIEALEKEKITKNILNLLDNLSELPEDTQGYQELSNRVDSKKRELQNEIAQLSMKVKILTEYKKYFIKEEQ